RVLVDLDETKILMILTAGACGPRCQPRSTAGLVMAHRLARTPEGLTRLSRCCTRRATMVPLSSRNDGPQRLGAGHAAIAGESGWRTGRRHDVPCTAPSCAQCALRWRCSQR